MKLCQSNIQRVLGPAFLPTLEVLCAFSSRLGTGCLTSSVLSNRNFRNDKALFRKMINYVVTEASECAGSKEECDG